MERFNSVVAKFYPDATPETFFVANSFQQLNTLGFGRNDTIACMGTCRDNSTRMLHDQLAETWGAVSLLQVDGCIVLADALEQVLDGQDVTDRPNFLFVVLTPIGIGTEAPLWPALADIQRECAYNPLAPSAMLDVDDALSTLRHQLAPYAREASPSLIELTFHAHNAMCDGLQRLIDDCSAEINYAVISGIQLHGNTDEALIWPGVGYAVVNGQRHVIDLEEAFAY